MADDLGITTPDTSGLDTSSVTEAAPTPSDVSGQAALDTIQTWGGGVTNLISGVTGAIGNIKAVTNDQYGGRVIVPVANIQGNAASQNNAIKNAGFSNKLKNLAVKLGAPVWAIVTVVGIGAVIAFSIFRHLLFGKK